MSASAELLVLLTQTQNKAQVKEGSLSLSLCFLRLVSMWAWVNRYQNVSTLNSVGTKADGGGVDKLVS